MASLESFMCSVSFPASTSFFDALFDLNHLIRVVAVFGLFALIAIFRDFIRDWRGTNVPELLFVISEVFLSCAVIVSWKINTSTEANIAGERSSSVAASGLLNSLSPWDVLGIATESSALFVAMSLVINLLRKLTS